MTKKAELTTFLLVLKHGYKMSDEHYDHARKLLEGVCDETWMDGYDEGRQDGYDACYDGHAGITF